MTTISFKAKNWWWLISVSCLILVFTDCKSKKTKQETKAEVKEYPKPATDAKTDSLKTTLDAERAKRLQQKQK